MADNTAKRASILHIGPESSATSGADADVVRALAQAESTAVEHCPDVYRGLARLCRPDGRRAPAVVVCMDQLGTPELEFFSILSRLGSRPPVYAYGAPRSRSRIARAIQLGASEATEDLMNRLLGSIPSRTFEPGLPSGPQRAEAATPSPPIEPAEAPDSPTSESEPITPPAGRRHNQRHEDAPTARVPWIEYPGRPARRSPAGGRSTSGREERTPPAGGSGAPLLTDEELRALIGDDLDPFENGGPTPSDRS